MAYFLIGILALVAITVNLASCKIFSKCELARELQRLNMPKAQIPDWICLVESESSMDSRIIGDSNLGLFQINSDYWCGKGRSSGGCNMRCEDLINDDISDDVACAKIIYQDSRGFTPWVGWSQKCNGRGLPDISTCGVSTSGYAASPVAAQAPISGHNWISQPKTSWVSQNTNWNTPKTISNAPKTNWNGVNSIWNTPKKTNWNVQQTSRNALNTNWKGVNTNLNTPKTNWNVQQTNRNALNTNWNTPKTNWNVPQINWRAQNVPPPAVKSWRSPAYNVAQYPSQHRTMYFRTPTG